MSIYPEYLFHYTSIETLALILKNRTIRFNSLCNVDDMQEQTTNDIQNYARFVFVSCWTDSEQESIPMWMMYAKRNESVGGVRIKLSTNPFYEHTIDSAEMIKAYGKNAISQIKIEGSITSYIPPKLFFNYLCFPPFTQQSSLHEVVYTDNESELSKAIFKDTIQPNGEFTVKLELGAMGKTKNKYWDFQDEWRYIFTVLPLQFKHQLFDNAVADKERTELYLNLKKGIASLPFAYFDLLITENAIKQIEITLSPLVSVGGRLIVDSFVKNYAATAVVKESSLKGIIK